MSDVAAAPRTSRSSISGTFTIAFPFDNVHLRGQKPLPASYPQELRTVGDHLKRRRIDLGIQQKELARRLGVTPWSLRLWEVGRTRPAIGQWAALIDFLGYDPIPTTEDIPS